MTNEFIRERFVARQKQARNHQTRVKRKMWQLCRFSKAECPTDLEKSTIREIQLELIV
jgi:hypothetical protein